MSVFDVKPTKSDGDGTWEIPEADSHVAALVALIDLGTHREQFKGEDAREVRKVYLCWELTEAPMSGTKGNHLIGQRYTLSLNEKSALYKVLKAGGVPLEDGKPFPLRTLLGKPCMVTVNHKSNRDGTRTYAEFGGFSPVPKQMRDKAAKPKLSPFSWEIPDDPVKAPAELKKLEDLVWLPKVYGEEIPDIIRHSREWDDLIRREPVGAGAPAGAATGDAGEDPF